MTQEDAAASPGVVAVVGLGLLGRGIATCFLAHGFHVVGCDRTQSSHAIANDYIERGLREIADHADLKEAFVGSWRDHYLAVRGFDDWPPCDFVVESIDEDPVAKQAALASFLASSCGR